jgi:orotate phosphoribosyltransferase
MGGIIEESQRRVGPTGLRTAFERNLLPGFAQWLMEQIEQWAPDYLVPAETKGVHVLDAALAYAREELGALISTPVLYGSALRYLPADVLRSCRVMIVEDAVRTGANLRRHRQEVEDQGVADVRAVACMGRAEERRGDADAECYLRVTSEIYTQYLWQLTELVVARGLPPEVDHFVFELTLPRPLTLAWPRLQALLASYGSLTVDGPASEGVQIQPMTLHFPRLPGMREAARDVSTDGPNKVRFFPDLDGERIFVLPISFPSFTLDSDLGRAGALSMDQALEAAANTLGYSSRVGDCLIEKSRELDPVTIFHAISTSREVEMMTAVARLLRSAMPGTRLVAEYDVFERLYGPAVGWEVDALVATDVGDALTEGVSHEPKADVRGAAEASPLVYLDASVATATRGLAEHLKALYERESHDGEEPERRVGLSMSQLADTLPDCDPLLASRCVSFGLTMTTLVPFIEITRLPDGSIKVERQYRVSEPGRWREDKAYRDLSLVKSEKSEQVLAVICNRLSERCSTYEGQPIPQVLLTQIVAILRPLILDEQSIELKIRPQAGRPSLVLLDTVGPVPIDAEPSKYFEFTENGAVRPTEKFRTLYSERRLYLDVDKITEGIETHVDSLASFIDELKGDASAVKKLLEGWTMSTDERLGLTHVRRSLDAALAELRSPLKVILREESHPRTCRIALRAQENVDLAVCKLSLLAGDWSAPAKERWAEASGRREERLITSLGASEESAVLYEFSEVLGRVIGFVGALVEHLDAASASNWQEGDKGTDRETATMVLTWCGRIRRALVSLAGDEPPVPSAPLEARAAIAFAADELLDLIEQLGAFAAAAAGVFRGVRGGRPALRQVGSARHLSVLSLDLANSTAHASAYERTHKKWVNEALDLAAQWTQAFGGWERPERKGDEITVEFENDGDATPLAAAAVLCHARALRLTGIDHLNWRFHAGVDCGEVEANHNAVSGHCLDRAAKIGKHGDGRTESTMVLLTAEATERCSEELRQQPVSCSGEEVVIGAFEGSSEVRLRVHTVLSAEALNHLAERLREIGQRLATELPVLLEAEPALNTESVPDDGLQEAAI